jgi:hypothetical protein
MDNQEAHTIWSYVESYRSIDLAEMLVVKYSDSKNMDNIKINQFTAREFMSITNKVFSRFEVALNGSDVHILPFEYNFQNEYGKSNLHNDFSELLSKIKTSNFSQTTNCLKRLAHYLAINGIWRDYAEIDIDENNSYFIEQKERLDLISRHLQMVSENADHLLEGMAEKRDDFLSFVILKKNEYSEMETLLDTSKSHDSRINELHISATQLVGKINSALAIADDKITTSDESIAKAQSFLDDAREIATSLDKDRSIYTREYESVLGDFQKSLEYVEGKKEFFEGRIKYLDDLIGKEVGASLFQTFKTRKDELNSSVWIWRLAIPVVAGFTIFWIYTLFGGGDITSMTLGIFAINTLKTVPAVFILLFSMAQYSKERNFQEEYAFKSAVALTLNAYAKQLDDVANRDKLIMDSVSGIYTSPIGQSKHKQKDSLAAVETIKGLADVAKGLLPKN